MLRHIGKAQIALQVGHEFLHQLAAGLVDINHTALAHRQGRTEPRQIVGRGFGVKQRQLPGVVQHLGVIKQLQFTLHTQGKLGHQQGLALLRRGFEELNGRGSALKCGGFNRGLGQWRCHKLLQGIGLIQGQRRMNRQRTGLAIKADFVVDCTAQVLWQSLQVRRLMQGDHHRAQLHPAAHGFGVKNLLLLPRSGHKLSHVLAVKARALHQPVTQSGGSLKKAA